MRYLFAACMLFTLGAFAQNKQKKKNMGPLPVADLQGHRGCRGLMPENTIPAMIKALELGVNTLEMDIAITADSQVILSHEPFFNHEITTKPNGEPVTESEEKLLNIHALTYNEVQTFDVGLKPHPRFPEQEKIAATKPTLVDVINTVKEWCKTNSKPLPFFNIETKTDLRGDEEYHPLPGQFVDLLMQVIQDAGIEKQTIIQSFDFRTLRYLKLKHPQIVLAALIEDFDKTPLMRHIQMLGFVPDIYSPAHELVNEAMVTTCRKMGMRLIPWTVNDMETANALKSLGVDGLITDYPDRIR